MNEPQIGQDAFRDSSLETTETYEAYLSEKSAVTGLDRITALAAQILNVPCCVLSVPNGNDLWLKSRRGYSESSIKRVLAPCDDVLEIGEVLVIPDLTQNDRYSGSPIALKDGQPQFFAGFPVLAEDGKVLASLSICGPGPRDLDETEREQMVWMTEMVTQQLRLEMASKSLQAERGKVAAHRRFFMDSIELNCVASMEGEFLTLNDAWTDTLGYSLDELMARPFLSFLHPDDVNPTLDAMKDLADATSVLRFRNRYRHQDGSYRWFEWSAFPPTEEQPHIFASAHDITHIVSTETNLRQRNRVLNAISQAQGEFISSGGQPEWWDGILGELLGITDSEYGFIGITGEDEDGKFLRTLAITNIAWNEETRSFYEQNAPSGLVFRNMDTLFGRAIVDEMPVIANHVADDPRAGGRPLGHPPLSQFAGLPISEDRTMVGLVGLANRAQGYDDDTLSLVQPLLALLATVIRNGDLEKQRHAAVRELESTQQIQAAILDSSDSGFIALRPNGQIAFANQRCGTFLPGDVGASPTHTDTVEQRLDRWFGEPSVTQAMMEQMVHGEDRAIEYKDLVLYRQSAQPLKVEVLAAPFRQPDGPGRGLLLTIHDRSRDLELAETQRINTGLEVRIEQLKQNQHENEILSECVEFLQSCVSLDEGLGLVEGSVKRLFPGGHASLYASVRRGDPMRNMREGGGRPNELGQDELAESDCWALRLRRVYGSWPDGHHPACAHAGPDSSAHYCIPLFSLDRNVGLITVSLPHVGEDAFQVQSRDARLSQFVAMAQSISGALSTIALRESLQRMALTDELTGLKNRRSFQTDVARMLSTCKRKHRAFGLALLDIDHFKNVNDEHGHDVGDRVLRQVAQVMLQSLREGDLVARVGGEEFAIFMEEVDEAVATRRLQDLLNNIRASCLVGGKPITASVGLAHSEAYAQCMEFDELYRDADTALYRAKDTGRDRLEHKPRVQPPQPASVE